MAGYRKHNQYGKKNPKGRKPGRTSKLIENAKPGGGISSCTGIITLEKGPETEKKKNDSTFKRPSWGMGGLVQRKPIPPKLKEFCSA